MKQVAQACHNFHDSKKHLPTPTMIVRKDGETREVALSWRFSILPFIDSNTLYSEFDRTVGWDHPNNARFQTMEIWVYALPHRDPDPAGQTRIQYFTGAGTLFPSNAPIKLTDIKDGTPNTLLLAEADEAVVWTRRADMAIRPNLELPLPAGGFYAGFADGTVRWISREATSDEILRQLIHPSDGKPDGDWDR